MKKIIIVDYGLGNIFSAQQSFLKVIRDNNFKINVIISNNPEEINSSSHIVLPGQGAFKSCIDALKSIPNMVNTLKENVLSKKKSFLGICVGMQLLADRSFENGNHEGLGWIKGSVKKLNGRDLKLPHMGWNKVSLNNSSKKTIFNQKNKDFYFVHSYHFECTDKEDTIGSTYYGENFTSIVVKENIYGTQFHPEKSSDQGLEIIKNFLKL